jgi:hypothetical protein
MLTKVAKLFRINALDRPSQNAMVRWQVAIGHFWYHYATNKGIKDTETPTLKLINVGVISK